MSNGGGRAYRTAPSLAPTYNAIQHRLRAERGTAVGRACHAPGCEALATGWGLIGPHTHIGPDQNGDQARYSTDLRAYEPLCRRHNARLDMGGSWERCPAGHRRSEVGATVNGTCRQCKRDSDRDGARRRRAR